MNKELLKDRNYISKLNFIKEVINKNWNQMEKINFALIERTREEMKIGLSPTTINLEETMCLISKSEILKVDNIFKIIINKCLSIIKFSYKVISDIGYHWSLWSNSRTVLEYTLFFKLLTNREWDKNKLINLAYNTSIHEWKSTKNPNGLFGIFKDRVNITKEMELIEKDMPIFYATLSSHSHPSLRLNDLSKDEINNSVIYFQNLYELTILLNCILSNFKV